MCYCPKYIKRYTIIHVPGVTVLERSLQSLGQENNIGTSYILFERLPGYPLRPRDVEEHDDDYELIVRAYAKNVFRRQLVRLVLKLVHVQ